MSIGLLVPAAPWPLFKCNTAARSTVLIVMLPVATPDAKASEVGETVRLPPCPVAVSGTAAL